LEKLAEVGETDAIRRQHAGYFRDLFERAPEDWLRKSDTELHATYVPELDNLRAALDWALGQFGDSAIGTGLAGASGVLWSMLGLFGEGQQRLQAAAARIEPHTSKLHEARLWLWLGRLMDESPAQARPAFERAAKLYRELDDASGLGQSLVRLGRILAYMGSFEQSEVVLSEARPLLERIGSPRLISFYFSNIAFLQTFTGDLCSARRNYEQALALNRDAGAEFGELATLVSLANVAWGL